MYLQQRWRKAGRGVKGLRGAPFEITYNCVDGEFAGPELLHHVLDVRRVAPAPAGGQKAEGVAWGHGGGGDEGPQGTAGIGH